MPSSTRRLFRETARISNSACSTSTKTTNLGGKLGSIQYHIFQEPLPYPIGLKLQNDLIDLRLERKASGRKSNDIILFLEHTPTYTTGRRDNSPNPDTLHPEEKKVQNVGAEFYITKRGGQVTYHGPGQLVGYPILDLNVMETPTRCYVDWLQALLADYVRDQGCSDILAPHPEGHVGIFASPTEKVASIGIHLRHRITSHGFAMNITPEPVKWFDLVMACGLADVHAVSLHDLIRKSGSSAGSMGTAGTAGIGSVGLPSVRDVARGLVPRFGKVFGRELVELNSSNQSVEGDSQELEGMWNLVQKAEEDAKRINMESGGWASEPDLSKRPVD